jgi:hypothetical protein
MRKEFPCMNLGLSKKKNPDLPEKKKQSIIKVILLFGMHPLGGEEEMSAFR